MLDDIRHPLNPTADRSVIVDRSTNILLTRNVVEKNFFALQSKFTVCAPSDTNLKEDCYEQF